MTELRDDRLAVLSRHPSDVVMVADAARRLTFVSPSIERMLGYTPAQYAAIPTTDLVHPDDRGEAARASAEVHAYPGAEARCEVRLRHADGSWRWVEIVAVNLDDDPGIEGVLSVVREITDRRAAEDARRASESRFRALVQHSSDGVAILDTTFAVTYVSPAVEATWGYKPDALVGRDGFEFVHPEDLEIAVAALHRAHLEPGVPITYEVRARRADGTYRWTEAVLTNLLGDKDVRGFVVNFHDIHDRRTAESELRASEERFRALVQSSPDIIVVSDENRRLTYVSPSVEVALGWTPEEFAGRYRSLVHPDDVDMSERFSARVRGQPGKHSVGTGRQRHKDGTWRWMEVTAVNLLGDPNVRGVITNYRDITDRKAAEDALRESEERFRSLVEHSSDAIGLLGDDLRYRWVSESVRRVLGHEPAELSGVAARDLAHPDDVDGLDQVTAELLGSPGLSVALHGRARHADGTYRWLDIVATNRLDDPSVGGLVVNFRDVTERRDADQALRVSEERFRALVQNAADTVITVDGAGFITYASPGFATLTGFTPEEAIGTTMASATHPDDLAEMREVWHRAIVNPGVGFPVVARSRHRDGEWRWVESVIQSRLDDPSVRGVVVNARDVTQKRAADEALRASEERFRALVQNSEDVMAVLDDDGTLTWVSPAVRRMLGHEPHDLVGAGGLDLLHPDDRTEAAEHLMALLAGERMGRALVVRVQHADGGWLWVDITATNMSENPVVGGVVVNLRDVTSQVEAQEALRASESRFRAIVQNASDVVQIMTADGHISYISPAVAAVLGHDPESMLGRSGADYCHPDDVAAAIDLVSRVVAEPGTPARLETRVRHADGTYRWVDTLVSNHLDDPGVGGIVATYRDITERKTAEHALRESEARFRSVAASSPIGIFQQLPGAGLRFVNQRWREITGSTAEAGWLAIIHPDDLDQASRAWERAGLQGEEVSITVRIVRPDGELRWVDVSTAPVLDDDGSVISHVGTLDDITDRLNAERDTDRLTAILGATSDLVAITDRNGKVLYMNAAARRFFEVADDDDLAVFDFAPFTPPAAQKRYVREAIPALKEAGIWSGELAYYRDGTEVPVSALFLAHRGDEGHLEFISSVTRDISERKAFEARLEHEATHDPLTGLPNRTLLLDRLEMAVARAARHEQTVAVLFLDLDHFKVVNDSLGHGLGDRLLVLLSERLKDVLRPGDTVARFGGDEFVILCEELDDRAAATGVAERIGEAVAAPFLIDDSEVFVTASTGIAFAVPARADPEALLRDADAAMYEAKARGRSRFAVFDERMRAGAVDRLELENMLRRAIERRELRVYYQPTIDLARGTIVGVEALLRWEHPARGVLLPNEFIGVAEETGLTVPIGAWVLEQTCRQVERWHATLPPTGPFLACVNLSARQLDHPTLIDELAAVLARTGVDPTQIGLEITEHVAMKDALATQETLAGLKRLGVKVAIDDFGTGYSSLAYLRRFPVDLLKVDRAFVDGLGRDPEDSAIVAAIITLAHTLGLEAIAEGVETAGQLAELRALGCDMAQGFLLCRPMPAAAITDLLARSPRW